ncbi:MAG: hypothetical protein HYS38_08570 [Acidobacteria bacterium]|nr:hypothetical protein [Acidobacteriota bacterium]
MASLYRIIFGVSWGLGLLSLVGAVVLKVVPAWREVVNTNSHGGLIFASALFLCALATREMQRVQSPTP